MKPSYAKAITALEARKVGIVHTLDRIRALLVRASREDDPLATLEVAADLEYDLLGDCDTVGALLDDLENEYLSIVNCVDEGHA